MKDVIPAIAPITLMLLVFLYGYFANPFESDFASTTRSHVKTPKTNQ